MGGVKGGPGENLHWPTQNLFTPSCILSNVILLIGFFYPPSFSNTRPCPISTPGLPHFRNHAIFYAFPFFFLSSTCVSPHLLFMGRVQGHQEQNRIQQSSERGPEKYFQMRRGSPRPTSLSIRAGWHRFGRQSISSKSSFKSPCTSQFFSLIAPCVCAYLDIWAVLCPEILTSLNITLQVSMSHI